ncbi:helix-hairpin-helix domain-containing protein [Chloroflexota bacterium]
MITAKLNKYGTVIILITLIAVIVISCIIIRAKYDPEQPVEISLPPPQELQGEIYIDGAVNNPGLYPLKPGDSIIDIIQAAGGITASADINKIKLYLPEAGIPEESQKVNINRAEARLLESLPGIGEVRAQAIINYRQKNGQFRSINELTKVEGISATTYENIKDLITVSD